MLDQATEEIMDWRDFSELEPTDIIEEWNTPNDREYSEHWVTRIVFETGRYNTDEPIVEFYSIGRFGQFVSSYYVSTLLEDWGRGLDLMGYEPHWKIEAEYMDEIREWMEGSCEEAGFSW